MCCSSRTWSDPAPSIYAFPALTLPPGHKHISVAISSLPLSHFPGPGRHLELREIQWWLRLAKQPKGREWLCAKRWDWALHILPAGNAETDVNQPESYRNHQAQETWSSRKDGRTWGGLPTEGLTKCKSSSQTWWASAKQKEETCSPHPWQNQDTRGSTWRTEDSKLDTKTASRNTGKGLQQAVPEVTASPAPDP